MRRRLAALTVVLSLAAACSLTTSFDGFTGGPKDAGPGGDAAPGTDAAGFTSDGASADDAESGTGSPGYVASVLADKPVAYWRLGEASPTTAVDEVGVHPGQYQQTAGLAVGVPGATGDANTAVDFKGGGSVSIGDVFDFASQRFSVELWVAPPASLTGYPRIIAKEIFEPKQQGWHLELSSAFKLSFGIHRDETDVFVSVDSLAREQFTHVVVTNDLDVLRMYVNGIIVDEQPVTLAILDTSALLTIGAGSNAADPFTGAIDDVALYDRALTLAQVAGHYEAAKH